VTGAEILAMIAMFIVAIVAAIWRRNGSSSYRDLFQSERERCSKIEQLLRNCLSDNKTDDNLDELSNMLQRRAELVSQRNAIQLQIARAGGESFAPLDLTKTAMMLQDEIRNIEHQIDSYKFAHGD